eukprot:831451-Rhodomonas_salina.1
MRVRYFALYCAVSPAAPKKWVGSWSRDLESDPRNSYRIPVHNGYPGTDNSTDNSIVKLHLPSGSATLRVSLRVSVLHPRHRNSYPMYPGVPVYLSRVHVYPAYPGIPDTRARVHVYPGRNSYPVQCGPNLPKWG